MGWPLAFNPFAQFKVSINGRSDDVLAVGAVEQEIVAVAAGLREQLARLAHRSSINQHGRFGGIPIMHVVRRNLIVPNKFSGVGVERHNGTRIKVVAFAALLRHYRIRIARADVVEIQFRIIGARHPSLSGAVCGSVFVRPSLNARLALARRGEEFPLQCSGLRIARLDESRIIEVVAANAQNDVIANDDRRDCRSVIQLRIGNLHFPSFLASARVEAHQVTVGAFKEQPVLIHPHAAIADGAAGVRRICVVPELSAGANIGRPNIIRRGEIENVVDQQRCGFDGDCVARRAGKARGPSER